MTELEQMVQNRPAGKRCILLKKTSTCSSTSRLGQYIQSYLDETGKKAEPASEAMVRRLKQGVGYLAKREKGRIYAEGFMFSELINATGATNVDPNSNPLDELSNAEIAKLVQQIWSNRLKQKNLKKAAHKMVFSLDPQLCKMLVLANKSADELLLTSVRETFSSYQAQFYPGHTLGYLIGIHHDKAHIHAHVLLYPQTDLGKPINISTRSKVKLEDGSYTRIDYQGFLKDTVENKVKEFYNNDIRKNIYSLELPTDYKAQKKLLTLAAVIAVEKNMVEMAIKGQNVDKSTFWQQVKGVKKQIMSAPRAVIRKALMTAYERQLSEFDKVTPESAKDALDGVLTLTERINKDLKGMGDKYRHVNKTSKVKGAWIKSRNTRTEIFKVQTILRNGYKMKWNTPSFLEDTDGRWYLKRMDKQDELGVTMRQIFDSNSRAFAKANADQQYMRDASDKVGRSAPMPSPYRTKRTSLDLQLQVLTQLRKKLQKEAEEEIEKERKEKDRVREKQAELSAKRDILLLQTAIYLKKMAGKKPLFLQQYEGWKMANKPIPITLEGVIGEAKEEDIQVQKATEEKYNTTVYAPDIARIVTPVEDDHRDKDEIVKEVVKALEKDKPKPYIPEEIDTKTKNVASSETDKARVDKMMRGDRDWLDFGM